jgi:FdhD protein
MHATPSDSLYIEPLTPAREVEITRWKDGVAEPAIDFVAAEEPLAIRVRGRTISVTMRTPGYDDELAAGFLLTEGVIHQPSDLLKIEPCERNEFGNVINVLLAPDVVVDFERLTRHVFASSSCGVCGKTSIEATQSQHPPIEASGFTVDPRVITLLPETMRAAQATFDQTGGLHAAALFDRAGKLIVLREDIGRHNAVDKVIGHCLLNAPAALAESILLVSGRASFEILQKSLAARIPVIAAVSAPSSLAVDFAIGSGQTLIGFLRGNRMNLYSGVHRVQS